MCPARCNGPVRGRHAPAGVGAHTLPVHHAHRGGGRGGRATDLEALLRRRSPVLALRLPRQRHAVQRPPALLLGRRLRRLLLLLGEGAGAGAAACCGCPPSSRSSGQHQRALLTARGRRRGLLLLLLHAANGLALWCVWGGGGWGPRRAHRGWAACVRGREGCVRRGAPHTQGGQGWVA